jgi:phosphatidylglycerol:prolipoprotein diacylglycerol transferase
MHFPINFHIGSVAINAHVVFEVLAYTTGFNYYLHLRKHSKDQISAEDRMWIIIAAAGGALIGSRLVGYFSSPLVAMDSLEQVMVRFFTAKSILGALVGGIFFVEMAKKIMGIKVYTGDLFTYPIILGMMIGRLGCFSQGVFDGTHGNPSGLPWAMDLGDGIPRHPAQLYEIIFLGITWLLIKRNEARLAEGSRFKVFMIAYLFYRLFIEWIKPAYFFSFGLSSVQIACVVGLIYYIPAFLHPYSLFKEK